MKYLSKVVALLLGLVAGLVVAELIARRVSPNVPFKIADSLFKTKKKPLNSARYRDYDYSPAKGPGEFRIVTVGDSFTEGKSINFDDIYPKKLERYLNLYCNRAGIRYSVLNMSRGGRDTQREVRVIKEQAQPREPDLILLAYCLNDAEDWGEPEKLMKLRERCCYLRFSEWKPQVWGGFLYDRFALARLIIDRTFAVSSRRGHRKYYRALYDEDYPGLRKVKEAFRDLAEFSRSSRVPVIVAIFPLFSYGLGDDYPFADIHEALHRALDEAGLPCLDLLAHYRDIKPNLLEYIPGRDPHPNEIAHRIAAEALWVALLESGLLPTKVAIPPGKVVYPATSPWSS